MCVQHAAVEREHIYRGEGEYGELKAVNLRFISGSETPVINSGLSKSMIWYSVVYQVWNLDMHFDMMAWGIHRSSTVFFHSFM